MRVGPITSCRPSTVATILTVCKLRQVFYSMATPANSTATFVDPRAADMLESSGCGGSRDITRGGARLLFTARPHSPVLNNDGWRGYPSIGVEAQHYRHGALLSAYSSFLSLDE